LFGDAALEAMAQLAHVRKSFPSVALTGANVATIEKMLRYQADRAMRAMSQQIGRQYFGLDAPVRLLTDVRCPPKTVYLTGYTSEPFVITRRVDGGIADELHLGPVP
jgi:hypothetical protein